MIQIILTKGESHTVEGIYAFHEVRYGVQEGLMETEGYTDSVAFIILPW